MRSIDNSATPTQNDEETEVKIYPNDHLLDICLPKIINIGTLEIEGIQSSTFLVHISSKYVIFTKLT